MSRAKLMEKYGLKKTIIHNIIKTMAKVKEAVKRSEYRKIWMRQCMSGALEREQLFPICGLNIHHAAKRIAVHLGHENFKMDGNGGAGGTKEL